MTRICGIALFLCLATALLAWVRKDALPPAATILPELAQDPVQAPVRIPALNVRKDGKDYTIRPLYSYELYGLVVSAHDSDSWIDFAHRLWGDTLNVRDLCVLWGDNVKDRLYDAFSFRNGDWTCFFRTNDSEAWSRFRLDQISNNHLLTDSATVKERLSRARVGDQIVLRGYLAEYEHSEGFKRGTSTTREDTGNGACETVYVTDFDVLHAANTGWRSMHSFSLTGVVASLLLWIWFFTRDVLRVAPRDSEAYYLRGTTYAARGRFARAERALSKALAIDPEHLDALRDRVQVREALGRFDQAQADRKTLERLEMRSQAHEL